ncbi:MAG: excinuclease ABC subunit UvrC [Candidatus Eisenbacteria bacterium]
MRKKILTKVEGLPRSPGVYSFKDKKGKVIYVGKAKSLRSRVRSYFREGEPLAPRTALLVRNIHDLDFIAAPSEIEALILECNLIKHLKPRYNVNLKDDKKFPYLKVTSRETFPRVFVTRNLKQDGSRYFGPYTDAKAMRRTLKFLNEVFPIRTCKRRLPLKRPDRGCLNYQIGRCIGPCRGEISSESYKRLTKQVCQYLSGRMTDLIKDLSKRMDIEAEKLRFEEAARLRDTVTSLEKVSQKQIIVSPNIRDRDVAAVRAGRHQAIGFVLKIREGKLVGKEVFRLAFEGEPDPGEILTAFLEQYLAMTTVLPDEILIEELTEGITLIKRWLRRKTGRHIKVSSPRGGKGRELLTMAGRNADLLLSQLSEATSSEPRIVSSVKELAKHLHLPELPVTIAAFDISTTQGAHPVGSRVFFRNGRPLKGLYRHYSIKTVEGQDDFAMMREVLKRAWSHVIGDEEERPDLVLIDGGRGQISSAIEGMLAAGCDRDKLPAVVGIAKRLDEVYLPHRVEPLQIPHGSPALRLLQRIRDEAHRFAVTFHRKVRGRATRRSKLEDIEGIGAVLSKRLLAEFGSLGKIKQLKAEELVGVSGMNIKRAEAVVRALGEKE